MAIEDTYQCGKKLEVFSSAKHGPYLRLDELLSAILDHVSDESRRDLISKIVCSFEFHKALAELLTTGSDGNDDEQSSWSVTDSEHYAADPVRAALLPHAQPAAIKFAEHLIKENMHLRTGLKEERNHLAKLEAEWPEPYKKYLPKKEHLYLQLPYLNGPDVEKLISIFDEQKKAGV